MALPRHSQTSAPAEASTVPALVASPYLHTEDGRIHNPMTDRDLTPESADFRPLARLVAGELVPADLDGALRERLQTEGWLVDPGRLDQVSAGYFLKYVSLEAHTVCNQACYFCPVSVAPREPHYMPMEQYREIAERSWMEVAGPPLAESHPLRL